MLFNMQTHSKTPSLRRMNSSSGYLHSSCKSPSCLADDIQKSHAPRKRQVSYRHNKPASELVFFFIRLIKQQQLSPLNMPQGLLGRGQSPFLKCSELTHPTEPLVGLPGLILCSFSNKHKPQFQLTTIQSQLGNQYFTPNKLLLTECQYFALYDENYL